ncbi:hypothetical protein MVEG_12383 [Podila verticillata NRRL 6337]|uniref:Uncharacterized protein n=1 Tax=Podila verticillata NRRL 6337 TaxID=1069443 RepID=A0A086TIM3_9FUNG|nr:hypothetical protein MVEG_12383 [Podila verticillata NRRL 6337]
MGRQQQKNCHISHIFGRWIALFKNLIDVFYRELMCQPRYTMRRYKYLNNDSAPQRDVAYNSKGIANKYVFQRSSLDICYFVCDTVDEFYDHYSKKTPCSRMYFEVINDEFSTQKFKLDIDGRVGNEEMEYILKVMRRIFRKLTTRKPEILVYDISTSYHVVVANLSFSATSCEMLANAIYEKVSKKYPLEASLIDTVVYKRCRCFVLKGVPNMHNVDGNISTVLGNYHRWRTLRRVLFHTLLTVITSMKGKSLMLCWILAHITTENMASETRKVARLFPKTLL